MSQLKIKNVNDNSWISIPAGGVGVPSGGSAGDVLTKSSSTDYATEWTTPASNEWTLLGTSSNSSQMVTYPSNAKEIFILGASSSTSKPAYSCVFLVDAIQDISILMVGGYYYGASDYGLANVNHVPSNRTLAFRNLRYSNSTTGTFTFYYR